MLTLVTADHRPARPALPGPRVRPVRAEVFVQAGLIAALREVGMTPLVLPPGEEALEPLLDRAQAVVLTGGDYDIPPEAYGRAPVPGPGKVDPVRAEAELALARACIARDIPVLGICAGMQVLAVAAGGALFQDIPREVEGALNHEQPTDPAEGWHSVRVEGSMLRQALGQAPVVNSTHHQAVCDPGELRVTARAPDGVIEAIELANHRFCLGVQWHPELLRQAPLFKLLARAAGW